jgi:hypothetical protein
MSEPMHEPLTCAAARKQFALLLYGELSFDEEERVESHLDHCVECRRMLEREKALHLAMDAVEVRPSPALLSRCREDLSELLDRERRGGLFAWWDQLMLGWNIRWLRPVGALTLVAIGFFAAKVTPGLNPGGFQAMSLADFSGAQVRNVATQPDGSVRIVLNETRQRTVAGSMADQQIRSLLLDAAREAADPGLRADTVTVLMGDADDADVRQTLVFALANDQSPSVRLKALQGLKRYADEPAVQNALAQVLLSDSNAGMRTQAIDLLTSRDGQELDRQIVGALQELMSRENDHDVRERCQRVLRSANASAEIY